MNGNWFVVGIAVVIFLFGFVSVWRAIENRRGIFAGGFGKFCKANGVVKVVMSVLLSYIFVVTGFLVMVLAACDIQLI